MVIHSLAILAITAPGLTYVLRVPPQAMTFPWMPQATPKQILHLAFFYGGSGEKFLLAMILWTAGAVAIWRERNSEPTPGSYWRGMLVISWAVVPPVLNALASLHHPVFVQRYMIFSLPATVMLAGRGMAALPKRRLGLWLVIVLCAASIPAIFVGYRKPREDWRNATNVILASAQSGDAVVIYPFYAIVGFDYYSQLDPHAPTLHLFTQPYYGFGDNDKTLLKALSSDSREFRRVWVMVRREGAGPRQSCKTILPRLPRSCSRFTERPRNGNSKTSPFWSSGDKQHRCNRLIARDCDSTRSLLRQLINMGCPVLAWFWLGRGSSPKPN